MSTFAHTQRNVPSFFGKVIATGFYDGPTEGFLVSKTKDDLFYFHLLDWDDGQDVRVFGIALLPGIALDTAIDVLLKDIPPQWPVWVMSGQLDESGEEFLETVRKAARPAAIAITRDLLQTFDVWQAVDEEFVFSSQDWLTPFGLKRSTAT